MTVNETNKEILDKISAISVDLAMVKSDIGWLKKMMWLFIAPIPGAMIAIGVQYLVTGKP